MPRGESRAFYLTVAIERAPRTGWIFIPVATGYLQFMSTRTDDDSGIDLLLFVALQVSIEWTSSRLKFCITISLRVTLLLGVVVRLVTNRSLRYQDTIGAGLPAEKKLYHFVSARFSFAEKKIIRHQRDAPHGDLRGANLREEMFNLWERESLRFRWF